MPYLKGDRWSDLYLRLPSFTALKRLDLSGNGVRDNDMAGLTTLRELRVLNLSQSKLTSSGLPALRAFPHLTNLNLEYPHHLTDKMIADLSPLTTLTSLNIRMSSVLTDDSVVHLSTLTNLTSLALGWGTAGTTLQHLSLLTKMVDINMSVNDLTDAGLEVMTGVFPHLTSLNLTYCSEITERGVNHISRLTALTRLNLVATPPLAFILFLFSPFCFRFRFLFFFFYWLFNFLFFFVSLPLWFPFPFFLFLFLFCLCLFSFSFPFLFSFSFSFLFCLLSS